MSKKKPLTTTQAIFVLHGTLATLDRIKRDLPMKVVGVIPYTHARAGITGLIDQLRKDS